MKATNWLRHFQENEARPARSVLRPRVLPDEKLLVPLLRSLQIFFAGETGEGRIVAQARAALEAENAELFEALRLYIAEEGRHARELAALIRALGATPRAQQPTARVFRWVRRLAGFRLKMLVLTAAEVVGIVYYDLLIERVDCKELAELLALIVTEERAHILFQREFFQHEIEQLSGLSPRAAGRLCEMVLGVVTALALSVFTLDQRRLLSELSIDAHEVFARGRAVVRQTGLEDLSSVAHSVRACRDAPSRSCGEKRPRGLPAFGVEASLFHLDASVLGYQEHG